MKQFKFSKAAFLIAGALTYPSIGYAAEQDSTGDEASKEHKLVVTGSRIKRTQGEGALPVTIITRQEMQQEGITSAEQLMLALNITANSTDNLASNNGITNSDNRGNNGFSGANFRQQGADSTLVLLNGRRVSTHGMKGRAVDINSIPFAAIERVEILRDGASAVYGTDAIGGVLNFILRNDYEGVEVSAFSDVTEAGGGNINRITLMGGFGNLINDGYNWVTTLSARKNEVLRGTDRDFTNTFQPNRGLSPDTRGPQFASINDRWSSPDDPTSGHYNLIGNGLDDPTDPDNAEASVINILDLPGGLGCDAFPNQGPYDHYLWNSYGSRYACAWDYPRASVIRQPVESNNIVSSLTATIGEDAEFFAEVVGSKVTATKVFEPIQITPWSLRTLDGSGNTHWYPSTGSSYQMIVDALTNQFGSSELNIGAPIAYRWRCMDCGPRQIETETTAGRALAGLRGTIGEWDWETAFSYASSEGKSHLSGGYYYEDGLARVLGSGDLNPFLLPGESQTQVGLDALAAASAAGTTLYSGKTEVKQFDASVTGDTGIELGGGSIMVATGVDLRWEYFKFNGDRRSQAEQDVVGRIEGAPFDESNILDKASRKVAAWYGEALLPITEDFEVTLAVRHDRYSGFGGTTNPKISFKYTPFEALLFRGAYNTGFRVPSFNQLFSGVREEDYTGQDLVDPATCPTLTVDENDPNCLPIQPNLIQGGKSDLQPEESKQYSWGIVAGLGENTSLNIDWWHINKIGTIQLPGLTAMVNNYDIFSENFLRDSTGRITSIDNRWVNAGERRTTGIEMGLKTKWEMLGGSWNYEFNGSYLVEDKSRIQTNVEFGPNAVGQHTRRNIPLRWKVTNKVSFSDGDWRHTLSQLYRHGYNDEVPVGIAAALEDGSAEALASIPSGWEPKVDAHITYNYSIAYSGFEDIRAVFGIKNIFDTDPPFTAHQNDFSPGAAYDPRIADPRGRAYTFLVEYKF